MKKMTLERPILAVALCMMLIAVALPAFAQPGQQVAEQVEDGMRDLLERIEQGEFGPESGQHSIPGGTVVSFDGDVVIEKQQTIEGDAVAFGGTVHVNGTVKGNVVSIGGSCRLSETARVHGDVLAIGGTVQRDDNAVVDGSSVQIDAPWAGAFVAEIREQAERADRAGEGTAEPDSAEREQEKTQERHPDEGMVKFGEDVVIEAGQVVGEDIVVFGGNVDVSGTVNGDIVALDGRVEVRSRGTVNGDIVAIGRDVALQSGARVTGDVVTIGGSLNKAHTATVGGRHQTLGWRSRLPDMDRVQRPFSRLGRRALNNLAFLVLLLILVVALPKQMDAVATRISEEPGRAILYGAIGLLLVLPMLVVMVFMVITWALIPLFIAAVAGLALVGLVGMDILIGRKLATWMRLSTDSLIGMAILGFLILAVAGMLAELPVVGAAGTVFLLAVFVFGFGGALMTGFGADPPGTWLFGPSGGGPQGPPPDGPQGGPTPQPGADVEPPQPAARDRKMAGEPFEGPQQQVQPKPDEAPGTELPPEPEDLSDAGTDDPYRPVEQELDLPEEDGLESPPEQPEPEESYETPPDEPGWEDPEE